MQYIDDRFGDNANQVNLSSYTLVVCLQLGRGNYSITVRVNNLTDEIYVPWSDVFYLQQNVSFCMQIRFYWHPLAVSKLA